MARKPAKSSKPAAKKAAAKKAAAKKSRAAPARRQAAKPVLHGIAFSGPTYKVALMYALCAKPFSYKHMDMRAGAQPQFAATDYLLGTREALGVSLSVVVSSIFGTLVFFFFLVLLRVLVRNQWLAAALFVAIFTAPKVLASNHLLADTLIWVSIYAIAAIAVVRFGLIVLAVATFMANVLLNLPFSLDFSSWYATHCVFVLLAFVAIASWGFYTSLAGQSLWKDELLE